MTSNSRLSKISDHNIFKNTDDLYEPLRKTIRKSMLSNQQFGQSTARTN